MILRLTFFRYPYNNTHREFGHPALVAVIPVGATFILLMLHDARSVPYHPINFNLIFYWGLQP
jgi:hypothetical protein